MALKVITIEKDIPSILIDRNFIKEIGTILERQLRDREKEATRLADIKINLETEKINNSEFYSTQKEKDEAIIVIQERERYTSRPHYNISYKINTTDNQSIEFSSFEDILNTSILPQDINEIIIHVYNYDSNYVDVHMSLKKPIGILFEVLPKKFTLSSNNEEKLLKIEKDLKETFGFFQQNYHSFLYPKGKLGYVWVFLISILISIILGYILFKNEIVHKKIELMSVYTVIFIYYISSVTIKYLYPFYEFKLTTINDSRKYFKSFLMFVISVILAGGIYDFVKFIFSS